MNIEAAEESVHLREKEVRTALQLLLTSAENKCAGGAHTLQSELT